jgi:hypothetical protein
MVIQLQDDTPPPHHLTNSMAQTISWGATVSQLLKKFPAFCEILSSHEEATDPCLEPDEYSPHPYTLFPHDPPSHQHLDQFPSCIKQHSVYVCLLQHTT